MVQSLAELGATLAARRRALKLTQGELARRAGVSRELVSRLEGGSVTEVGVRKLIALLAALELELRIDERGVGETLDDLRRERSGG